MIEDFNGLRFGLTIAKELLDHHPALNRGQRGKREEIRCHSRQSVRKSRRFRGYGSE